MRRPAEALKESQEGVKIIQNLADANPGVPQFQKDLGFGLSAMGRLHAQEKQFTEAFVALDRALAMLQKLADAHPTYSDYTLRLASGHFDRGWAHLHAGHPAQAAADLRRSVALSEKAARNDQLVERSRALALLARWGGDAKSGVTTAEAATFADKAVASLRGAIKAGWGSLKEPDFDALRGRADFQKLLTELEQKSAARPK